MIEKRIRHENFHDFRAFQAKKVENQGKRYSSMFQAAQELPGVKRELVEARAELEVLRNPSKDIVIRKDLGPIERLLAENTDPKNSYTLERAESLQVVASLLDRDLPIDSLKRNQSKNFTESLREAPQVWTNHLDELSKTSKNDLRAIMQAISNAEIYIKRYVESDDNFVVRVSDFEKLYGKIVASLDDPTRKGAPSKSLMFAAVAFKHYFIDAPAPKQ